MEGTAQTRLGVEQRKRELVDVGASIALRGDIDTMTLEMVAETAGVSRGLVYRYFPGKEALLVEVMERHCDQLLDGTRPPADLDLHDRLRVGLNWYLDYASTHSAHYIALRRGSTSMHPRVRAVVERNMTAQRDRILDGIRSMGIDGPLVEAAVRGWLEFLASITVDWIERGARPDERPLRLAMDTLNAAVAAAAQ